MIYALITATIAGASLRISCRIYDGTGSMKVVLTKGIASKVLQKNLSELILLSNQPVSNSNQFQTSVCTIQLPDTIDIIEAVSEYHPIERVISSL